MTTYAFIRGNHGDIYGDDEGVVRSIAVSSSVLNQIPREANTPLELVFDFKAGRAHDNPERTYEISLEDARNGERFSLALSASHGQPLEKKWMPKAINGHIDTRGL